MYFFNTSHNFKILASTKWLRCHLMVINVPEFIHILCHSFSLPIIIYDQNLYYRLDKTQKGLSLKVPYFVTEVIFGQKFINLLQQNVYN